MDPLNVFAVSLLVLVPYFFFFWSSLFPTKPALSQPSTLVRPLLTVLVVVHTVHTLGLLLSPPVNLFKLLGLPLNASTSSIRTALLEYQRPQFPVGFMNKISPDVEMLLSKLASFEARIFYIRYGPYPLSRCTACVHMSDFTLFALAPTVLPYLRALILVSLITARAAARPAWRTPASIVLTATFVTEMWWKVDSTVHFTDRKLEGWTYTQTYLARYAVLLLLPLLIHHLPEYSSLSALPPFFTYDIPRPAFPHMSSDFRLLNGGAAPQTPPRNNPGVTRSYSTPVFAHAGPSTSHEPPQPQPSDVRPSTPIAALTGTLSSLSTTLSTLRVLEWARMAGLRRGSLREKMASYYATEDLDAAYARSDGELRREAERLGMGYAPRPSFGGRSSTWRGNGDPRGLDSDSVIEDEDEEYADEARADARRAERRQERERRAEEAELAQSPLRAKARKAAKELAQTYLGGVGDG